MSYQKKAEQITDNYLEIEHIQDSIDKLTEFGKALMRSDLPDIEIIADELDPSHPSQVNLLHPSKNNETGMPTGQPDTERVVGYQKIFNGRKFQRINVLSIRIPNQLMLGVISYMIDKMKTDKKYFEQQIEANIRKHPRKVTYPEQSSNNALQQGHD